MIKELSVHVKPKGNKGKLLFTALMLVAATVVLVSMFIERYKGVVGLVGMIAIVIATWIYTRYIAVEYYYDVTFDSSGEPIFIVRQIIGKRQSTLSRISLADIVDVTLQDAAERKAHKTPRDTRRYVYVPTVFSERVCRITTKNRYEKAEVLIEVSDEFASLLRSYAEEARAMRAAEDDF